MTRTFFLLAAFVISQLSAPANAQSCAPFEISKLLASDLAANDSFGSAVAILGDTAVIGAYRDLPDGNAMASGSVYVFHFDGIQWVEQTRLNPADSSRGFGFSVAIDTDIIVVGARFDDANGSASGAAYIFRFNGNQWVQESKVIASDGRRNDEFGYSVAVDGNVVVVGAPQNNLSGPGWAYVYRFNGTDWIQETKLIASDGQPKDDFGQAVAISGNAALIGAWNTGNTGQSFPDGEGAVYVYRFTGTQWTQETIIPTPTPLPGERNRFGNAISLEGDLALIGASPISVSNPIAPGGVAYIYRCIDGEEWRNEATLIASDIQPGDRFGASVSLSGDLAAVGAWGQWSIDEPCSQNPPFPGVCNVGAAYIFQLQTDSTWQEQAKLISSDAAEGDLFGWAVAIDADKALAGAWRNEDAGPNSGSAYIFDLACTTPCLVDFTNDGVVDVLDFFAFITLFQASDPAADLTGDGNIDVLDFFEFISLFNAGCP